MTRTGTLLTVVLAALGAGGCGSADAPAQPNATTQRAIAVHMRTRNGPFSISIGYATGPSIQVQASPGGEGWIVNPVLDASNLSTGRYTIAVKVETQQDSLQEYLITASVSEDNRTVRPDFPDIVVRLTAGGNVTFPVEF